MAPLTSSFNATSQGVWPRRNLRDAILVRSNSLLEEIDHSENQCRNLRSWTLQKDVQQQEINFNKTILNCTSLKTSVTG